MRSGVDDQHMKMLLDVAKDAMELPVGQRLTLARILLDVSDADRDDSPEVEAAWEEEIVNRIAKVKAGKAQARSFESVFADLERRFPS